MVLPQSLLRRYRRDFAAYANTVSRFEQQTLCEFMAGGYFTRHLARMRLAYKRRMETLPRRCGRPCRAWNWTVYSGCIFADAAPSRE